MRDLRVLTYSDGHLDCMEVLPIFEDEATLRKKIKANTGIGRMVTVFSGRKPIAILGVIPFRDDMAEIWTITTRDIKEVGIRFHRLCVKLLRTTFVDYGLTRAQIYVRSDFPEGKRWAQSLGFEFEGRLKRFGPNGVDCFLYARCK